MKTNKAKVLLVDDSKADQIVIQRALEDGNIDCDISLADNGSMALQYLKHEKAYPDTGSFLTPDLILLDINMPVLDGLSTLREIRSDTQLRHFPVIMLTTSNREKDVYESYDAGVNAYLIKPIETSDFVNVVQQLENFWFNLVVLPTHYDNIKDKAYE